MHTASVYTTSEKLPLHSLDVRRSAQRAAKRARRRRVTHDVARAVPVLLTMIRARLADRPEDDIQTWVRPYCATEEIYATVILYI